MGKKKVKLKQKVKLTIYSFVLLSIISIYILFSSTMFNLNNIELDGNKRLTREDIIKYGSISLNENLFQYKLNKIEKQLKENSYIKSVKVKRKFPNRLYIAIEEYEENAIISINNKYVVINKSGKILSEEEKVINKYIPIIYNANIEQCKVGSDIKLEDNVIKEKLLYLLECIYNNNLNRDIKSIKLNKDYIEMVNDDSIKISMNLDDYIEYNTKRLSSIMVDLKSKNIKTGNLDIRNKEQGVYSPL